VAYDDLLQLEATDSPQRFRCALSRGILTPAGTLQGGAGLGIALQATEQVTGRPTIWAAAQYLSFAPGTASVDVDVAIEVTGHNTTQARCMLSRDGQEILTAHIALGARPFDQEGVWVAPPRVPEPLDCPAFEFFAINRQDLGGLTDFRLASGRQPRELRGVPGQGNSAYWCRVEKRPHLVGAAELAFLGDFLPLGFCEPFGQRYAGTSIDNTMRFGQRAESEWVLLDCRMEQVANGFGYGQAHLWSQDGRLLATASQTMVMRFQSGDTDTFARSTRREPAPPGPPAPLT
jgi:acyl-CoA thioesterase II